RLAGRTARRLLDGDFWPRGRTLLDGGPRTGTVEHGELRDVRDAADVVRVHVAGVERGAVVRGIFVGVPHEAAQEPDAHRFELVAQGFLFEIEVALESAARLVAELPLAEQAMQDVALLADDLDLELLDGALDVAVVMTDVRADAIDERGGEAALGGDLVQALR